MTHKAWDIVEGTGPAVAVALHDGHEVREELQPLMALSESDRLREEDPFTGEWTAIAPTRIIARRSRFEVDFNRTPDKAVYLTPGDAWGLTVWKNPLSEDVLARSRAIHSEFYAAVSELFGRMIQKHGKIVVYELHSYNHRRLGPEAPFDDPMMNPQVNLGTAYNPRHWRPVLERFKSELRACDFPGGRLDVGENVKFKGGYFPQWVAATFPETVCDVFVEFKKFFMDEWTGQLDAQLHGAIRSALASTLPGVLEELERL